MLTSLGETLRQTRSSVALSGDLNWFPYAARLAAGVRAAPPEIARLRDRHDVSLRLLSVIGTQRL